MTVLKGFSIICICLAGAIITGIISALVWFLLFLIFPPGPSSGGFVTVTFSSNENTAIGVILMAIMGLIIGSAIGLVIGLAASAAKLSFFIAAVIGAIISFVLPMLFVMAMASDSASRGAGGDKGMAGAVALLLIGPQLLTGALSGSALWFLSKSIFQAINK